MSTCWEVMEPKVGIPYLFKLANCAYLVSSVFHFVTSDCWIVQILCHPWHSGTAPIQEHILPAWVAVIITEHLHIQNTTTKLSFINCFRSNIQERFHIFETTKVLLIYCKIIKSINLAEVLHSWHVFISKWRLLLWLPSSHRNMPCWY